MLEDTPDHRALGSIVNDDRLTRLPHSLENGGEVVGVGGGQAGDGLEVVEEGEVADDEDVGEGEVVGFVEDEEIWSRE